MEWNHEPDEHRLPRFQVSMAAGLLDRPRDGRVLVVLSPRTDLEPRHLIGMLGPNAPTVIGRDAAEFGTDSILTLDDLAASPSAFTTPGRGFLAQAIFDHNRELRLPHAPGNLTSQPVVGRMGNQESICRLMLSRAIPPEHPPMETAQCRYVQYLSPRLSSFHDRPIFLRAGIILPRGYDREPARRYPLRVNIGGYGSRYSIIDRMMAPGTGFRTAWDGEETPRMILLRLDGAGPLGDPHQVNSANHGPYGDAVVHELIPHVEQNFRAIGTPGTRFLDGVSTGGWAALALQIFYPDHFNGAWACCPDSVDFRSFETINIESDQNAYFDEKGVERAASRDLSGRVVTTIRQECALENALGRNDSWTLSGGQWGAWNATFSPRGSDGLPIPLWHATGAIDRSVAEHWSRYDLRKILERDWPTLGPRLRGKLHVTAGEADEYYLNTAVHSLDAFLSTASPPYEGSIVYGLGEGHGWCHLDEEMLLREMVARCDAG